MNKMVVRKVKELGRPIVFVNLADKPHTVDTYLPERDGKLFDAEFLRSLTAPYVDEETGQSLPTRLFIGDKEFTDE